MIEGNPTGTEWVEMAWAARNTQQPGMNAERREWFEGVKCLLDAPVLRANVIQPPAKVTELRARNG